MLPSPPILRFLPSLPSPYAVFPTLVSHPSPSLRLQRRLITDGLVGMTCRIAAKIDNVTYPMIMLSHIRASVRQEKCDELTIDLRESIRKSCAAALGNLSYVK